MKIIARTKSVEGAPAYNLTDDQQLIVGRNVVLSTTFGPAIEGEGSNIRVNVAGTVLSGSNDQADGIALNTDTGNVSVTVSATGRVVGVENGVELFGQEVRLTNAGVIEGRLAVVLRGETKATLINTGTILGDSDAVVRTIEGGPTFLRNSGTIISQSQWVILLPEKNDVVINSGFILGLGAKGGEIDLGGGNDLYDGRKAKAVGIVDGADGRDTFRAGSIKENFVGGEGFDTVDYRSSTTGVNVSLAAGTGSAGRAKGDTLDGIERVQGSAKGNDVLLAVGVSTNVVLDGFGGRDKLTGGVGNDVLIGGKGRDRLDGGAGQDSFGYLNVTEGGDKLNFEAGTDMFVFQSKGFGKLAVGDLTGRAGLFHSGLTNRAADRGDRFIWETDRTMLWFDRDGSGKKFAPVLVADLQAGAVLSAEDIVIVSNLNSHLL